MYRKYNNKKSIVDGINFDSKKEATRYKELKTLERAGIIQDLQRQVKYVLLNMSRQARFTQKAKKRASRKKAS